MYEVLAAILHDTIENIMTMAQYLILNFGQEITDSVLEVTDDKTFL